MFKKWAIGMAALCAATGVLAETHYIPSGEDNLIHNFLNGTQVAGKTFSSGDTIVLMDAGPYINDELVFRGDVIIRSFNKDIEPSFETRSAGVLQLTFEANAQLYGLKIDQELHFSTNQNNSYLVANSTFNTQTGFNLHAYGSSANITLIGNTFEVEKVSVDTGNFLIVGNKFHLASSGTSNIQLFSSNNASQFVGNEVISTTTNNSDENDSVLFIRSGPVNIIGNRFLQITHEDNLFLDTFISFYNPFFSSQWTNLRDDAVSTTGSLLQNNSFAIQGSSGIDTIGWRFMYSEEANSHYKLFNNVFQSIPSGIPNEPLYAIDHLESTTIQFANNIIVNYPGNVIAQHGLSSIQNNLCFNGSSALCDSLIAIDNSNMQADPQFASTDTFALSAGSPAIDAGIDSVRHQDSKDNSRNDLGVFGGAFPIDFFDQQLDPNATQPYLYPLIHVQDTATENTLRVKAVAFARQ